MDAEHSGIEYVGFWARVAASLLDTLLICIVIVPPLVAIYGWDYFDAQEPVSGPADFLLSWVVPAVAVIAFWLKRQATPGKLLLDAVIVDAKTLGKPSTGQFIGRYLGYFVSTIPLCLGLIWVGVDARKQGWHDKLAGTLVIRPRHRSASDTAD